MKLKLCPFCMGEPKIIVIDESMSKENAGGTCIECSKCGVSSRVYFGELDGLMQEAWNTRMSDFPPGIGNKK